MTILNTAQKEAVEYTQGPLLIIAGAGTGKTTVLTEKVKHLIQEKRLKPEEILALTFTEKAAAEMVERLDTVMPYGYREPWVHTFHRFGDRILRDEGLEVGLDPNYVILSRTKQYLLMKEHLFDFPLVYYRPLGNPSKFIWELITFFSRCADESVSIDELKDFSQKRLKEAKSEEEKEMGEKLLEATRAFEFYQKLKIQESVMDFGDLIGKTLELLEKRKSVLAKYKRQFKHVLIDEFQDTNFAQYQLIKLLAPAEDRSGLTVVGDDSQSIYRFRGAAISNILTFMEDYPKAKQVVLTENYRSNQNILDGAYQLIKQNDPETLEVRLGISKNLIGHKGNGSWKPEAGNRIKKSEAVIVECVSGDDEVEMVVSKIFELLALGNYTYADFAILARANSHLEPYVTALKEQGLPYRRVGNRGLFDQEEVKILLQFLRVVTYPDDGMALFDLLYYPGFKIKPAKVLAILQKARREAKSLWKVVKEDEEFRQVVDMVETAQEGVVSKRASTILGEFVRETEYIKPWIEEESIEHNLKIKNLNKFFEYVKQLERGGQQSTVGLVDELEELIESGENPSQAEIEDVDAITISTVHSAKGLEFGVVFVVSVTAGRFPAYSRRDVIELPNEVLNEDLPEFDNTAEERRLFYVAVTRAKDHLFLSFAADYGGARKWKPSGFLAETGFSKRQHKPGSQLSLLSGKKVKTPMIEPRGGEFVLSRVSYSQIDTFQMCPLKYKYRYILEIPAESHHALSFGQTMHAVLQNFHTLEAMGKEPGLAEMMGIYEKAFIDEGYESEAHKEERFAAGKQALTRYVGEYKEVLGSPWRLEQKFRLRLGEVTLVGKIDRIDKVADKYWIVDYKTGSSEKKRQVDKDEQLSIYALAAQVALGIEIEKLALYFIEDGEKVETTRSLSQLERKREDLVTVVEEMKKSDFAAKPGFNCKFCEYARICPFADKG